MLDYGMVSVEEFKAHVGIKDDVDDAVIQRIINMTAATIERAAGRPLRRDHARTEYFPGGGRVIRVDVAPIAQVHSVRESETRNFTDPDQYQELVEGTDYIIDTEEDGGRKGESGVLRRLNSKWLGSASNPGQVQVIYTGGYKTDEEVNLENGTITIGTSQGDVEDYNLYRTSNPVLHSVERDTDEYYLVGTDRHGILRFRTAGVMLPTWGISGYTFRHFVRGSVAFLNYSLYLLSVDPQLSSLPDLFAAVENGTFFASAVAVNNTNFGVVTFSTLSDDTTALMQRSVVDGHITFGFVRSGDLIQIASTENPQSAIRPTLRITHRSLSSDVFSMPGDLKHANLVQAVHEYQTRKQPGMISQAMRGVAVASGASYLKTQARLLPEVEEIAASYRRLV